MEAVGAAASIVGIVSFGLGLAKTLQAFTDTIIDAEESIILITAEISATASTLKRLQDFIDQDNTALREGTRSSLLTESGVTEIGSFALLCQKIYVQIIVLIEKASGQTDEDGNPQGGTGPKATAAEEDLSAAAFRLEAFSSKVTKLGRGIRWAWLEPRIRRCQEHLGRFKLSLMLSLQVFQIAARHAHPSAMHVLNADDEHEMRAMAEILRQRVVESQVKSTKRPRSASSSNTNSVVDGGSVRSSGSHSIIPPSGCSSVDEELVPGSPPFSLSRYLGDALVYCRKKTERKTKFSFDSTSAIFGAYLITAEVLPSGLRRPPIKLAFGHRRLVKQIKQALRIGNPWDMYLVLNSYHRAVIDTLIQEVRLAAAKNTSVCLVAIACDGIDSNRDITAQSIGDLMLTNIVVFFCFEQGRTQDEGDPSPDSLRAILKHLLIGRNQKRKELLVQLAARKAEEERQEKEREDREEEAVRLKSDKTALEAQTKKLETDKTSLERQKNSLERKEQALTNIEELVLKLLAQSTPDDELKKAILKEYTKIEIESRKEPELKMAEATGDDQLPIKFRDAVGRKYAFPFRLARTWRVMEGLINQAFAHIEGIGPHVRKGRYDLEGPDGNLIMKEIWDTTIQPGWQVNMKMWPVTSPPPPEFSGLSPTRGPLPMPMPPRFGGGPGITVMPRKKRGGTKQLESGWSGFWGQPAGKSNKKKMAARQEPVLLGAGGNGPSSDGSDDSAGIDEELGLDTLKVIEQLASKDVDALLTDWTTAGKGEPDEQVADSSL